MICFAVDEIFFFEPKAKNTFPSFRTQRSMKISSLVFLRGFILIAEAAAFSV
jgi:hypothetical protein